MCGATGRLEVALSYGQDCVMVEWEEWKGVSRGWGLPRRNQKSPARTPARGWEEHSFR